MQAPIHDDNRCISTPELDDLALIAAIDGEASPDVLDHLRRCSYCAARAQHYAELQGLLRKQFFRMFCPSTDTLVAYHDGTLSVTEHSQLRTHLAECPHCRREIHFLEQLTSDSVGGRAPPDHWYTMGASALRHPSARDSATRREPLRQVLAERTHMSRVDALSDFYGAARARSQISQYAFQAENLQITIGVRKVVNRADRHVVTGSLTLHDDLPIGMHDSVAYLFDAQRQTATAPLDELGNFVLDNLIPGTYRLSFHLPDREVIIETIGL